MLHLSELFNVPAESFSQRPTTLLSIDKGGGSQVNKFEHVHMVGEGEFHKCSYGDLSVDRQTVSGNCAQGLSGSVWDGTFGSDLPFTILDYKKLYHE